MTKTILVLNAGSSSIKFAAYDADTSAVMLRGALTGIGSGRPALEVATDLAENGALPPLPPEVPEGDMMYFLLKMLGKRYPCVQVVGHRVVHGGLEYTAPVVVGEDVAAHLRTLIPLAPLHEPHNLYGIEMARRIWPEALQIAAFDTAFHRSQPQVAQRFAIPDNLHAAGVQRYGFHGLSYDFIAQTLPDHVGALAQGRVIVAHLGNGASMCAMKGGKSVATTMGMTALDGLMMGTRSGAIDPGAVLHLMDIHKMSSAQISDLLYTRSGLKGVSGISGDLRVLEASDDPKAELALSLFAFRARQAIGALAATIGGLDALVFTGGIGQHSSAMRARICEGMEWLGIDLDPSANAGHSVHLQREAAALRILALPTDEEIVIFRAARSLGIAQLETAS